MTTKLRGEMDNAMVLRGFSPCTRECYLACVTALAEHYGRSPDGLDSAQIQAYLLHLIAEKKLAYASVNQAVCAFRFLFDAVLGHKRLALEIPMAKVPKRLPQILSREEVVNRDRNPRVSGGGPNSGAEFSDVAWPIFFSYRRFSVFSGL